MSFYFSSFRFFLLFKYPVKILKFAADASGPSQPIQEITSPVFTAISSINGLYVDAGNNIWVSVSDFASNNNSIYEFAPNAGAGATPLAIISGTNTTLNFPGGLAVDNAGYIYVANGDGKILVFAPGSNGDVKPEQIITSTTGSGQTTYPLAISYTDPA